MENVEFTSDILLHLRLLKLGAGNYKLTLGVSKMECQPYQTPKHIWKGEENRLRYSLTMIF